MCVPEVVVERSGTKKSLDDQLSQKVIWVPFNLSFVEYPQGDWIGFIFAFSSTFPLTLVGGCLGQLYFWRNFNTAFFCSGLLINEVINLTLKKLIKGPRPITDRVVYGIYGMPSSHSQHAWFFATYAGIVLLYSTDIPWQETICTTVFLVLSAAFVAYSRVYLKYHTYNQIVVGGVVGIALAINWYMLSTYLISHFGQHPELELFPHQTL